MRESKGKSFEENLAQLERDGFLLIKNVLDMETVQKWRDSLYGRYNRGEYDRRNSVGNVSYNQLLEQEPEMTRALIAHPSVAPYLKATLGKQCQLRSVRAHLNPDDYTQEWHMDFYDYWYQQEKVDASRFVQGFCMNTTFYLTDNTPERARLTFVKDLCHRPIPEEPSGTSLVQGRSKQSVPALVRRAATYRFVSNERGCGGILQSSASPGCQNGTRSRRRDSWEYRLSLSAEPDVSRYPLRQSSTGYA